MSPRVAPLSAEPKVSMAFFSSSISSALTESVTRLLCRSMAITLASSRSPWAKRPGRWSSRSRASSALRMKPGSVPSISTSMPPSTPLATAHVTTWPRSILARAAASGSASSCLTPRPILSLTTSTSSTRAFTRSPFL